MLWSCEYIPLKIALHHHNRNNSAITQSDLLGQFRLISDRASDVSGGRICLTQNAYAEI